MLAVPVLAAPVLAASTSALDQPGTLGFLVVFGMGVILFFVFRSMAKHLRKVNTAAQQDAMAAASDSSVSDGTSSAGSMSDGTMSDGTMSDGTMSDGTMSDGTVTASAPKDGTVPR
jgi:hypothetical protein